MLTADDDGEQVGCFEVSSILILKHDIFETVSLARVTVEIHYGVLTEPRTNSKQ